MKLKHQTVRPAPAEANCEVRCAIYTRKSTDEGLDSEFNSLDAQREYCAKYIESQKHKGWYVLPETYDDGDYSGGDTDRPGLQRLLADVRAGLIDIVVVHRFDRLSRCSLDFGQVNAVLKKYRVIIFSITEQFDTTKAAGRLAVHNMVGYAEFMRDNSIELTLAKIAAVKQKGMWCGGVPPLGYSSVDKKLTINETEAEIIRLIFKQFLKTKSMKLIAGLLREKGIKTRAHIFKNKKTGLERTIGGNYLSRKALYHIINNPIYNGKVSHRGIIYPGQHQGIIDDETWEAAQNILKVRAPVRSGVTRQKPAALRGLLECAYCGSPMMLTFTRKKNGKIYRYYIASAHMQGRVVGCQGDRQVSASEIEAVVLAQMELVFKEPEVIVAAWKSVNEGRGDDSAEVPEDEIRELLSGISAVWQNLFPAEQERLLHMVLEKVVLWNDSIELQVRMDGLMTVVREQSAAMAGMLNGGSGIVSVKVPFQVKKNGVRKLISLPEGSGNIKPKYKPDKTLVANLVKAYVWQKQLDGGKSVKDLMRKYSVVQSEVYRWLRMNLLAPKIKEAILNGTQPRSMHSKMMRKPWPDEWDAQMRWFGFGGGSGPATCTDSEGKEFCTALVA